jgi:hypothetical protein
MRARGGSLLVLAALLTQAVPAGAWVRSKTTGCHPVYWTTSCVYIQPDSVLTDDMTPAEAKRLIQQSIAAWQSKTTGSYLKLNYLEPDVPREARFDKQPVIKFRTGKWCRPGDCAGDKETCYDSSAAAITTVFFVNKPEDATQDGQILDADIEMNNVNNIFYDADGAKPITDGRSLADLENTLVHELGHLQGLEHTCRASSNDGTPECTIDDQGDRPPLCGVAIANAPRDPKYQDIVDTTMFATALPGETKKRTPEADDVAAINSIYPSAKDPKSCTKTGAKDQCGGGGGGGCTVSPRTSSAAGLPLLLLCGLLLRTRRLRRGRPR